MKKYKSKITSLKLKKIFEKEDIFKKSEKYFNDFFNQKIKDENLEDILKKYFKNEIFNQKLDLKIIDYSINFENDEIILKINNWIFNWKTCIWEYFFIFKDKKFFTTKNLDKTI